MCGERSLHQGLKPFFRQIHVVGEATTHKTTLGSGRSCGLWGAAVLRRTLACAEGCAPGKSFDLQNRNAGRMPALPKLDVTFYKAIIPHGVCSTGSSEGVLTPGGASPAPTREFNTQESSRQKRIQD